MQYNVISADSHVIEPQDLWLTYMERKYRDRAPHVERKDGNDYFLVEGQTPASMMAMANAGQSSDKLRQTSRWDEMRPGGWDADARVKDMLLDGVDAEVMYPSLGMRMYKLKDLEFMHACIEAYNDWVADFCKRQPSRIRAVAMLDTDDMEWAVTEMRRTAKKGLVGATIPGTQPDDKGYHTHYFDPLWAAAQELNMPVSLHVTTGKKEEFSPQRFFASYGTLPHFIAESIIDMIFSNVFDRFPKLQIVSAENDVGWISNVLERIDHFYNRYRYTRKVNLPALPSEVFKQHVRATFIRDHAGVHLRHLIGLENIIWSSDYPHSDSTWPHSAKVIDDHFRGVPDAERRMIVCTNAAKTYGFT